MARTRQQSSQSPALSQGVAFPQVDGRPSTTTAGKAIFAAAAEQVDRELSEAIAGASDWRKRYVGHVRRLVERTARTPEGALAAARAGIAAVNEQFAFVRSAHRHPMTEAGALPPQVGLHTVEVRGAAREPETELRVPYRGEVLAGDRLHRQLDRWVAQGIVEPSLAESIRAVMSTPEWLDLSDQQVVTLGAGAEMGPLRALCAWGAHVIPVDLPRASQWGSILATVRAGRGRASVPVRTAVRDTGDLDALAGVAGADLCTDTPELAAWLESFAGPLTLGNYAYADGAAHARVAVGADALIAALLSRRSDCTVAFLATPTDVFAVPEDVVGAAQQRFAERRRRLAGRFEGALRLASRGRLFAPNYTELVTVGSPWRFGIADALIPQQGPNYVLAKRLQRWRAIAARAEGVPVSANVAAPTRTRSVMRNRLLAAAYSSAHRYGVEVFEPATSNTLMAALLVHDLRNPKAVGRPETPLEHPLQVFTDSANHGGLWRQPFDPRSALGVAVLLGFIPGLR